MSISHQKIIDLAQQYRSKLQRENEIYFANNKPGVGKDYYDFIEGLDSKCDHIRDDHRYGYQNTKTEGDLKSTLDAANIDIDKSSSEYSLLIEKFLSVAAETCYELLSVYKGESDFKLDSTKLITGKPPVKRRAETIAIQEEINRIAREIITKHPKTLKSYLADEIADKLKEDGRFKRVPKSDAIRKYYLDKHPSF
jgi:hypothetical protein